MIQRTEFHFKNEIQFNLTKIKIRIHKRTFQIRKVFYLEFVSMICQIFELYKSDVLRLAEDHLKLAHHAD